MSDPKRLLDGGADASERALLESLRAEGPSDDERAGMWTALAAQAVAAGVSSTASAGVAPAKVGLAKVAGAVLPKAIAAKVAVVVAVGAVGAGAALVQYGEPPAPAAPRVRKSVQETEQQAVARVIADARGGGPRYPFETQTCVDGEATELATGCAVSGDPDQVLPTLAPAKPAKRRALAKPAAVPMPSPMLDALQAESRMLAAARAQLRAGELQSVEWTLNQLRDQFAQGALGQEREVLQIELLAKLGDQEGADHRARRFLRKHPDSPHAKTVQRFLIDP